MGASQPDSPEEQVTVFTVGHSNIPQARFIALLQRHGIQSLVDVRSAPYSRYVPHFNRPELEDAVDRAKIRYLYMGDTLGGRPPTDDFYDAESHVLYSRVAVAPFFLDGLERLKDEAAIYRTAIMCSEEDPITGTGTNRQAVGDTGTKRDSISMQNSPAYSFPCP